MDEIKFNDFAREAKLRQREYLNSFNNVINSGWYILGKEVEKFEKNFAEYLGVKHCIGVGNGLEALQISLMALNIGEGDEVITTPLSAVATTLAILAVGAKPVFVDINEVGQIDVDKIGKAISFKTKAILPVHLYGQPAEVNKIKRICKENNLFLIEDAAQAHGAFLRGKKLGTYGDIADFSFYPTKNLGAFGDGGAIVTNNSKYAEICRVIRDYGQKDKYIHTRYGLNSRLDELQASLLSKKLNHLDSDNNKRRLLAKRYLRSLEKITDVKIVLPSNLEDSNFHLFVIRTTRRDELKEFLIKRKIPVLIHYPKIIPDQVFLKNSFKDLDLPVSRRFVKEILSLPCHPFMNYNQIDYISSEIFHFFGKG